MVLQGQALHPLSHALQIFTDASREDCFTDASRESWVLTLESSLQEGLGPFQKENCM